jgi:hypothetical protein
LNTDTNRVERRGKCGLHCPRRTERCSVFHPDPGLSGWPGPGWGKLFFIHSVSQLSQHIARDKQNLNKIKNIRILAIHVTVSLGKNRQNIYGIFV